MDDSQLIAILEAELRRRDFWEFCLYADRPFFERRPFLRQIADAFQDIYEGRILKLAVCLPPRAGKSRISSFFCAWMLGNKPWGSVMRNSVTATLYKKLSYDTREIILSPAFLNTFPSVSLAPDKQSVDGWNTNQAQQVSYFGAGAGGTIIGFGATLVAMTDDLFKDFEDGVSETVTDSVWTWYTGTHMSRMEKGCPAIDIGTRWSQKDVIGRNIEDGYYDRVIIIPAMDDDGMSFCEDVKSTDEYLAIKRKVHPTIWNAEYMQQPAEVEGVLFKKSKLNRFSRKTFMERIAQRDDDGNPTFPVEAKIGFIDVADEGDDAFSFPSAYVIDDKVYVTDWIFTEDNIDVTLPRCTEEIGRIGHDYVRVESNNQGSAFHKMLVRETGIGADRLLKVFNKSNKHTRIIMAYGVVMNNFYFLQDDEIQPGSDYDRAIDQLTTYMKSEKNKHDDAPDSIAGLAKFLQALLPNRFK